MKHIITVFTVKRSNSKRQRIILITIVTILLLFIVYGYHSIFLLYLYGYPFCLDAFHVGLLSLAQAITIFVITFLIMLCKKTLNDTYILPIVGSLAFIASLVLFSIVKKIWLLYIGKIILISIYLYLQVFSCLHWKFVLCYIADTSNKSYQTT